MHRFLRTLLLLIARSARWAVAHWKGLLTLLSLGVLLLALTRLAMPVMVFGSLHTQLQSSLLPPAASTLLAALAGAVLIMVDPPWLAWLLRGTHRRQVALAVVALAVIGALPTVLQGNFGGDGRALKWVRHNDDGSLDTSSRDTDAYTGEKFEPMTRELALKLRRQSRSAPAEVRGSPCRIAFFDGAGGRPIIWWVQRPNGGVYFFGGPGYDTQSRRELQPVQPEQVEAWTAACPR